MTVLCQRCGAPRTAAGPGRRPKWCSACARFLRNQHAPRPGICIGCGVCFVRRRWKKDAFKYCSRQCAFRDPQLKRANAARLRALPRNPRTSKQMNRRPHQDRNCRVCGQSFQWGRAQLCSDACRRAATRDSTRRQNQLRRAASGALRLAACLSCGRALSGKSRLYCSKRCRKTFKKYTHFWQGASPDLRALVALAGQLKALNRVRYAVNSGRRVDALPYVPETAEVQLGQYLLG